VGTQGWVSDVCGSGHIPSRSTPTENAHRRRPDRGYALGNVSATQLDAETGLAVRRIRIPRLVLAPGGRESSRRPMYPVAVMDAPEMMNVSFGRTSLVVAAGDGPGG